MHDELPHDRISWHRRKEMHVGSTKIVLHKRRPERAELQDHLSRGSQKWFCTWAGTVVPQASTNGHRDNRKVHGAPVDPGQTLRSLSGLRLRLYADHD